MALAEFALIDRCFTGLGSKREDVMLGVGDDCALLQVPPERVLAVSIDTLVEGVHFLPGTDPMSLGHRALAVNLSDLAAMGAQPAWATLALTLPSADLPWVRAFARGFHDLACLHGVQLVGGDTTRGPRSITIEVHGFCDPAKVIRRDAARIGDQLCISGTLGDAGLALLAETGKLMPDERIRPQRDKLLRPSPRVELGCRLAGIAHGGIDVSDGLLADLGHICRASGVGAEIDLWRLPLSPGVRAYVEQTREWSLPLAAGDDYELCITLSPERVGEAEIISAECGTPLTPIGRITRDPGIRCLALSGRRVELASGGFEHFADES
jgi:thiamine-monophosphate kinase